VYDTSNEVSMRYHEIGVLTPKNHDSKEIIYENHLETIV